MKLDMQSITIIAIIIFMLVYSCLCAPAPKKYYTPRRRSTPLYSPSINGGLLEYSNNPSTYGQEEFRFKTRSRHAGRPIGKTEHYQNKTSSMWQSAPSQADINEVTGSSTNKITSEFLTPLRYKKKEQACGRPRFHDAIPSHV